MSARTLVAFLFFLVLWGQSSTILVLHKGASTLGFYSPDGRMAASVAVGQHPHEMVMSADGRFMYTTDNGTMRIEQAGTGGNTVSIVDLQARKKVGTISLGQYRRPHGIALDPKTGRLAVSCELPDQLLIVDPVKRTVVKTYETKGKTAHMVTLGRDGRFAYVSNSTSANIAAIDLASGAVKLIPTGQRPEGSVLSPDGRYLYVATRVGNKISIVDTVKNEAAGEIQTSPGTVRIAITPDGRTLVYAMLEGQAVGFADPKTRKQVAQVKLGGQPVSMHLSPDGKLAFASAEEMDTVYVVSVPDRKLVREFKTAAGAAPDPAMLLK